MKEGKLSLKTHRGWCCYRIVLTYFVIDDEVKKFVIIFIETFLADVNKK